MLTELRNVPQVPGEPKRRWYTSSLFDLIVWYRDESEIEGFQLCYRDGEDERAFTWLLDRGFSHNRVDDGEIQPEHHKMTPTLVADGLLDQENVLSMFRNESSAVDAGIVDLVAEKIREYEPRPG